MCILVEILQDWRPDVIHFQWTPFPLCDRWFLHALRRIAPIICTIHDIVPFNGNPISTIQVLGAVRILREFDAVVAHTQRSVQHLTSLSPGPRRIRHIAHGLLQHGTGPRALVSEVESTSEGKLVVLFFGKLKPYKGLDVLIRAASLIPARLQSHIRLRIVGKPYMDTRALIAMAESLQVTHLIDFQFRFIDDGEISALLQAASVIVLPYREVDASGVLMTALAEGRPIVATRVGAMAELLTDGQDALLVPVGDADLLASALSQVLEDRAVRQRLADGARRLGASIPTWRDIGRETVALYDEVIAPETRARQTKEETVAHDPRELDQEH
jgi:glycosyltransferase involved in cell wall biosynthesis